MPKNPVKDKEERRKRMVALHLRNVEKEKIFERMADEFDIEEDTVKQDWYRRSNWISKYFDAEDVDDIKTDIVAEQAQIKEDLRELMDEAEYIEQYDKRVKEKRSTLKEIRKTNEKQLEILQEAGLAEKQAEKLELQGSVEEALKEIEDELEHEDDGEDTV